MELLTSYPLNTTIPSAGVYKTFFAEATSQRARQGLPKCNSLVQILECAAACKIPVLPATWGRGLEEVAMSGATGTIAQGLVNAKASLAFKRFKSHPDDENLPVSEFRDYQYEAMTTEMMILSRFSLIKYVNITRLIGLCFEPSAMYNEVWPVLLFIKYNEGDLERFRVKKGFLDEELMLKICGEVAKGLHILHVNSTTLQI